MALGDPYAPCPCGSDKKYKWCCQKVESFIERAQKLVQNKQLEAAVGVLDEGLAKNAGSPWLLLRKALLLAALSRPAEAKKCCSEVLRQQPDHIGAAVLNVRLSISHEGAAEAASEFQQALSRVKPEHRADLLPTCAALAEALATEGLLPAALKHLELALALSPDDASMLGSTYRSLKSSPEYPTWLKEPFRLSGPPAGLDETTRGQFEQAIGWAEEGLLESAAAAFELLAGNPASAAEADRNLGLCRLWLGDQDAAADALRRYAARKGETTEAVDLAVLCQLIDPAGDPEPVEQVQLTWSLRDRDELLRRLRSEETIAEDGTRHRDPEDEESPELVCFHWLDRPAIEARPGLRREEIPLIQADILVDQDQVTLETHDDGRLNELIDRFSALASNSVPPAHPRTKVLDRFPRSAHALSWYWYLPPKLSSAEKTRLSIEASAHVLTETWPKTALETLGGRTPLQAAQSGRDAIALRAELLRVESSSDPSVRAVDWKGLRARLGVPPEPEIDPEHVDIDEVTLGRLYAVPYRALDDDRLVRYLERVNEWGLTTLLADASREVAGRPAAGFEGKVTPILVFGNLAMDACERGEFNEALDWVGRGRVWGDARRRAELAPHWDMLEIQARALHQDPEEWVPELAIVLERYRNDEKASLALSTRMLEMGLLRLVSPPDRPGEVMLDSRALQQLLSRYGPKVTTSSGYLGVSASKGEIWTPESAAKGSGSIWTPGSDAPGTEDRPRIIVAGQ